MGFQGEFGHACSFVEEWPLTEGLKARKGAICGHKLVGIRV